MSTRRDDRVPIGNDRIPIGNDRIPIGNDRIPIGNDRVPIGNDRIPIGNDRIPIGNDRVEIGDNRSRRQTPEPQLEREDRLTGGHEDDDVEIAATIDDEDEYEDD